MITEQQGKDYTTVSTTSRTHTTCTWG